MTRTQNSISTKQLKELHTLHEISLEALHQYNLEHCPHRGSYVVAKLLVYAVEHKDDIHLDRTDTDALKGILFLLQELEEAKFQLMS